MTAAPITVKILGAGCANCRRLEAAIGQVVAARGLAVAVEKVTDYAEIMRWPLLATPGLVVNDRLVAAGRIPAADEIARWLTA